jgi:uncharacterized protein (DUF2384 family)
LASKETRQKPPKPTAEDAAVVVFMDGHFFIYDAARRLVKRIENKAGVDDHALRKDYPADLTEDLFERQRNLMAHAIDAFETVTPSRARSKDTLFKFVSGAHSSSTNETTIEETIARAAEILGSREEAMRWLGNPVRGLDFATPISLLGTLEGVSRVNEILGQIEYCVW